MRSGANPDTAGERASESLRAASNALGVQVQSILKRAVQRRGAGATLASVRVLEGSEQRACQMLPVQGPTMRLKPARGRAGVGPNRRRRRRKRPRPGLPDGQLHSAPRSALGTRNPSRGNCGQGLRPDRRRSPQGARDPRCRGCSGSNGTTTWRHARTASPAPAPGLPGALQSR